MGRASRVGNVSLPASFWANPFSVQKHGRAAAVEKYRQHMRASPALQAEIPKLAGKVLRCHCQPQQACHIDVLLSEFRRQSARPNPSAIRSTSASIPTVLRQRQPVRVVRTVEGSSSGRQPLFAKKAGHASGISPEQRTLCAETDHTSVATSAHAVLPQLYWDPADVNDALAAAKPAAWKGAGDLIQLPWECRNRGLFLVVDLWAGVGGLLVALVSLGCRCIVLAAEQDQGVARCHARAFPQSVMVQYVESVNATMLDAVIKRRDFRAILIAGGAPCQGNSELNRSRQGLADQRTQHAHHLQRVVAECATRFALPTLCLLENVGSAPREVVEFYSKLVGARPVVCQAAQFGWVARNRFFWFAGPRGTASDIVDFRLPPSVTFDVADASDLVAGSIVYRGSKPIPEKIFFSGGFQTLFNHVAWVEERLEPT